LFVDPWSFAFCALDEEPVEDAKMDWRSAKGGHAQVIGAEEHILEAP
jgi:hypothetical protein